MQTPHGTTGLRALLAEHGARPVHIRNLLRNWLTGSGLRESDRPRGRSARLPRSLEAALPEIQNLLDSLVAEVATSSGEDGSCRHLLRLRSGRSVECVALPDRGVCVSTQVGCAVGCRFCKTGEDGLLQQLDALEILAQLVFVRRRRQVRKVVLMGMGEPTHNLASVLESIHAMGTEGDVAHKSIVFSTVGEPGLTRTLLGSRVRPALALSLHTLDEQLRHGLLPRAPRVNPEDLLADGLDYSDSITWPLLIQWTVLEGYNDDPAEARRLAALLRGRRAIVNFIPFNEVEGNGFRRPPIERCVELVRAVRGQGALATLRMSAGQDVDGGCGQLRSRVRNADPAA